MISRNAERIQSSLNKIKKISGAAFRALGAFLVAYLLLTALVLGYIIFTLVGSGTSFSALFWLGIRAIPMILSVVITLFVCATLMLIFRDISKGASPFTDAQSKKFKVIGLLLLLSFVLGALTSIFPLPYTELGALTFGVFATPQDPTGLDINLSYVVWAIVCFSFSYVLSYGALLQQLSDETV